MLKKFLSGPAAAGIFTILAAVFALVIANSSYAGNYESGAESLKHFINDWLMIGFFLVIALELKREMAGGMLSSFGQIMLPLVAAIGGMAVPALIYAILNNGTEALNGWAIPAATDIAFALSILLIAGRHLPPSLKIFLLAIAIFDDLGAILIIAIFYSDSLALMPLGFAVLTAGAMFMMNRSKILSVKPYLAFGALLAYLLHLTGIHTTIAGVITGFMIPRESNKKLLHSIHPYSAFLIVPLFAFINAGINLDEITMRQIMRPITLGVVLGLFLGKQAGIYGTTWLAVKFKVAQLPKSATWGDIYAISVIAGIGFTMSLFIGMLAFSEPFMQEQVKIGVLGGSLLSAILGCILLRFRKRQ